MKKVVRVSMRSLLDDLRKKISPEEIVKQSGIETYRPSAFISRHVKEAETIPFNLADYVLAQTIFASDPVERAFHNLAEAGLSDEQLAGVRAIIESMRPKGADAVDLIVKPPAETKLHTLIELKSANYMSLPQGFERPQKGRTNRRNEYRIVPYSTEPLKGAVQIPCFESVAAGFGEDLEQSEDLVHVRELPDWKGVHSLIVRGDSMEDTLKPRDMILIETFNNGDGLTMEGLQPDQEKTPYQQVQKRIPDDEIFVLSIDDEPPTVKRVVYDTHKPHDWHLAIVADNNQYKLRVLTRGTPIRFYGRLIAIGQRDGKKDYANRRPEQVLPNRIEQKLKRKK